MRRIVLIALFAALAAAPSAHAAGARLTPTGGASFPQRSYVLTLPAGASPSSSGIRVFEDGQPVTRLRVRGANDRFAVVLVIDASASMRGAPIRGAIDAARAFAAQRPATQALGIVTFNARTAVAVAPTTNGSAIQRALARAPSLAPETHIYDALSTALRSASGRRFDAAAIVLLSDGHDFGSTTTPAQVTLAAQRAHAKLFTIGLRSHDFDPTTLQQVATLGSGEYLGAASPKALAGVYRRLGSELATAYSIRYLSSAPAGAAVRVTAQAGPERTGLSYAAPRLNVHGAFTGPVTASKGADPSFFATKRGAAVVALGVLLLAFFALTTVLQHRRRRGALQRRVAHYGETSRPFEVDGFGVSDESPLEGSAFWARLHADLELARMDITPGRFLLEGALMTALMAIAVLAVVGSAVLAVLALLAGPLVVWTRLRRTVAKQRRQFAEQLADSIQVVASAMRTGNSFAGAIAQLVENAPEPTASEFRRVIADERLGVPIEQALGTIVERMQNRDLQQVTLVSVIQRETGGNGAEALDRVVGNIRAKDDIRRLVRVLTSQGRLAQAVLTALPVLTLIVLRVIGGSTMDPLFDTGIGRALLGVALVLVICGGLWIGRIVKVRV